jgi:hypothetical protein
MGSTFLLNLHKKYSSLEKMCLLFNCMLSAYRSQFLIYDISLLCSDFCMSVDLGFHVPLSHTVSALCHNSIQQRCFAKYIRVLIWKWCPCNISWILVSPCFINQFGLRVYCPLKYEPYKQNRYAAIRVFEVIGFSRS